SLRIGGGRGASPDSSFPTGPITASTLDEFNAGMVGTWQGCVTTPTGWVPKYWVTMTFRSDGTYSARSDEVLDGQHMIAMYYGTDEDSPDKVWHLVDVHADGTASGTIDIVFDVGSVNRDDIRQIRLMGDKLQFEYWHFNTYGPVIFQLKRS